MNERLHFLLGLLMSLSMLAGVIGCAGDQIDKKTIKEGTKACKVKADCCKCKDCKCSGCYCK